jgi:hypothetical protein
VLVIWLGLAIRVWAIATLADAFRTTVEVDPGSAHHPGHLVAATLSTPPAFELRIAALSAHSVYAPATSADPTALALRRKGRE